MIADRGREGPVSRIRRPDNPTTNTHHYLILMMCLKLILYCHRQHRSQVKIRFKFDNSNVCMHSYTLVNTLSYFYGKFYIIWVHLTNFPAIGLAESHGTPVFRPEKTKKLKKKWITCATLIFFIGKINKNSSDSVIERIWQRKENVVKTEKGRPHVRTLYSQPQSTASAENEKISLSHTHPTLSTLHYFFFTFSKVY